MLGYVDSAIGRVRTVIAAESAYVKAHPQVGYACTFSQLPQDPLIARLTDDGIDNGYAFEIVGCDRVNPKSPRLIYHVTARPLRTELPAFRSDPSEVLKTDESGSVEKCLASGVPWGSQ
jgi:hypothetical protein